MSERERSVFISYGHNNYDLLVDKVAKAIREQGFNVFLDKDYLNEGDWEEIIDNHIKGSRYFLFMISARSVSHDGYCLNELCRAGETHARIIPVKLDDSLAPLSINKFQRMPLDTCILPDGSINEEIFNSVINKIIDIISGKVKSGYVDNDSIIKSALNPINQKEDLCKHYTVFKGRRKAFEEFEEFMNSEENILWLPASPGTGKTAFSSMLCWKYPKLVGGIHFCKFNNSDRTNPKNIFTTLAYQLAESLPLYKQKLLELNELGKVFEKNAERIFEYLFIEPLIGIKPDHNIALVIDALDEASFRGDNEVCAILQRAKLKDIIPSWLKFVLTSRREVEVTNNLNYVSVICKRFEETTLEDIKEYYLDQFPNLDNEKLEILLNKSEGSFLYATEITKQVRDNILSLDDINLFPPGIYGFFNDCFNRIFSSDHNKKISFEEAKPVLEFLCIFQEVVTEEFLQEILKKDEYEIRLILSSISGLFKITSNGIEPIHKSLIDWLVTPGDVGHIYYISRKSGYKRLYDYLLTFYEKGRYSNVYVSKYYGKTLIELHKIDELEELLNNYRFLVARNRVLHFDTGLREYLRELESFDDCYDIFSQETFARVFRDNRRLLYNSGMFFDLQKLGLTDALSDLEGTFELEGEIGVAFYYYIVEEFDKAIRQCKLLINSNKEIQDKPELLAELHNVKGLSQRKIVEFDEAIGSFGNAIKCSNDAKDSIPSKNSDPAFEESMAYLILGKIYTNMLDFNKANECLDKSVEILNNRIDELDDGDDKTAKLLFLAEEYRVYAYSCIWENDFKKAEDLLNKCDMIYRNNKSSTDRYFLRYQYTSCLLKIMSNEVKGIEVKLNSLLSSIKGKYDRGTINMYLGLLCLFTNDDRAMSFIDEAKKIFKRIKAYLELNEAQMIGEIYNELHNISEDIDYEFRNEYAKKWIEYAKEYVKKRTLLGVK